MKTYTGMWSGRKYTEKDLKKFPHGMPNEPIYHHSMLEEAMELLLKIDKKQKREKV